MFPLLSFLNPVFSLQKWNCQYEYRWIRWPLSCQKRHPEQKRDHSDPRHSRTHGNRLDWQPKRGHPRVSDERFSEKSEPKGRPFAEPRKLKILVRESSTWGSGGRGDALSHQTGQGLWRVFRAHVKIKSHPKEFSFHVFGLFIYQCLYEAKINCLNSHINGISYFSLPTCNNGWNKCKNIQSGKLTVAPWLPLHFCKCTHTKKTWLALVLSFCVCRGIARSWKGAYFGAGTGPVLLDEVSCTGNELSVEQCPKKAWGEHNCDHSEDAGVSCTPLNGE